MKIKLLLILGLFAINSALFSQRNTVPNSNPLVSQMDSLVHQYACDLIENNFKVGLSIAVYHNGKIYKYHYGSTELEKQQLPSDQTVYEIASISKTFTGTMLAKAINDGKISLEDDIRKYLKDDYPNLLHKKQPILVKHLANHRSGLPRNIPYDSKMWENPDFDKLPFQLVEFEKDYSKEDWLKELHKVKLRAKPGNDFQYSNLGANLCAILLENIYEKDFDSLLKEALLDPLSMPNTTFLLNDIDTNQLAKAYNNNGLEMPYMLDNSWAAGGLKSTLEDMTQYLKFQMDETISLVKTSRQKIWSTQDGDYSNTLFWQQFNNGPNGRNIFQYGGAFGFSSAITLFPEHDLGFVLLSNESGPQSQDQLGNIARQIVEAIKK